MAMIPKFASSHTEGSLLDLDVKSISKGLKAAL